MTRFNPAKIKRKLAQKKGRDNFRSATEQIQRHCIQARNAKSSKEHENLFICGLFKELVTHAIGL